jgi:hypothetical protein
MTNTPTTADEREAFHYANQFVTTPRKELLAWQQDKADDYLAGIAHERESAMLAGQLTIPNISSEAYHSSEPSADEAFEKALKEAAKQALSAHPDWETGAKWGRDYSKRESAAEIRLSQTILEQLQRANKASDAIKDARNAELEAQVKDTNQKFDEVWASYMNACKRIAELEQGPKTGDE